ncbi:MAG: hypothetical protein JWR74_3221 [Polaromonas sp.]|nr:hypothetical protein [Polaromonas sp.]
MQMTRRSSTSWWMRALDEKREAAQRRNHLTQLARGSRKPLPKYLEKETA